MNYSVTGEQAERIDSHTVREIGIPSVVLMERAALGIARAVRRHKAGTAKVLCLCGSGNNGADGIAAGRILHCRGYQVQLVLVGKKEHCTEEHQNQLGIAGRLGIPVCQFEDWSKKPEYEIVIDALFGTGLSRPLEGNYQMAVELINSWRDAYVIAVDIPSGIHADTGEIVGKAIWAQETVTFGYAKTGQLLYPGKQFTGTLSILDIGFPPEIIKKTGWDTVYYDRRDISLLPERPAYSNKGTYGKVLVIAGSTGMGGAAYFSAMAAYRMGAGAVKILTVEENRTILQGLAPEVMIAAYTEELIDSRPEEFYNLLVEQCGWATVIVLGPGLGSGACVEKVVSGILSRAYVPIVLDADGLNAVARHPYLTGYFTENIIITPHLGEMARLTGKQVSAIAPRILAAAREFSTLYGVTCVLKDAVTVVVDKDGVSYINTSGCSAMAKGGSGDVLSGMIAGLLALGVEEGEAARLGVYLHGCAGEKAAAQKGSHGVTASDLLDCITH